MTIWYLARATGLVALIAFTMSTALGALGSAHRGTSPRALDRRYLRQLAHRSAAILGLVMLAAHVLLILADIYVNVSVTAAVLPFTAGYRPLALGLGSIAVYLFILVAVSGAARGRLATSARASRNWRRIHLLAYVGWALSMGHGLLAGTDTGARWTTAIYALCGVAVLIAAATRMGSHSYHRQHPLVAARAQLAGRSGS